MKLLQKLFSTILLLLALNTSAQNKYHCMVQMANYKGEAAYVVISLVNPQGQYEKTLYMMGDDKQWYDSLKEWFGFFTNKKTNIDAITGASITGGDRKIIKLDLDDSKLDKGYTIRFESAVEDQKYYTIDAQIPFSSEAITEKVNGSGYIRYVKFNKIQ